MPKDLTVELENQPGTLAKALEAIGKAGINIDGVCGMAVDGKAMLHVLVEDAGGTRRALEEAGITVQAERDVIVTAVEDTPGAAGRLFRRIAEAGVNVELGYMATNTRVVIGADNLDKARQQLQAGVGAPEAHT